MNRVRIIAMALLVTGLGLISTGCDQTGATGTEVASFKGGCLTLADLQAHGEKLGRKQEYREDPGRLTGQVIFEHAVNMELIIAKGLKEKLHQDPRIRAEIHGFMADLFLKALGPKLVPEIKRDDFSDAEVRAYFDAHPKSYRTPELYGLRVIKGENAETLSGIRARIEAGALTFAEAARQYSTDARSKGRGGYIGLRALSRFRPDWRKIIGGLDIHETSRPCRIKTDWYLFYLDEKTPAQPHDFEKRKAYVRNDLLYAKYRQAWQSAYDKLKTEFDLEVADKNLDRFLQEEKTKTEAG